MANAIAAAVGTVEHMHDGDRVTVVAFDTTARMVVPPTPVDADSRPGIEAAIRAEHGYRHTALIHSRNVDNVTRMARALNTTLFIQNAPCYASLGANGPGYLSYSIATPTGEGVTTPLTFTRERQLTVGGALRFI